MARRRGRLIKNPPLVTVGSSVSATVIADTLECGNTQQIVTPTRPPFTSRSLEVGATSAHAGALKKLVLSPSPSINQGRSTNTAKENLTEAPWAKLFAGNRSAENGMPLTYITPKVVNGQYVVNLAKLEVENETEK